MRTKAQKEATMRNHAKMRLTSAKASIYNALNHVGTIQDKIRLKLAISRINLVLKNW